MVQFSLRQLFAFITMFAVGIGMLTLGGYFITVPGTAGLILTLVLWALGPCVLSGAVLMPIIGICQRCNLQAPRFSLKSLLGSVALYALVMAAGMMIRI